MVNPVTKSDHLQIHVSWWNIVSGIVALITAVVAVVYAYVDLQNQLKTISNSIKTLSDKQNSTDIDTIKAQIENIKAHPSKSDLDWVGVWEGKWEDTWFVRFTIFLTEGGKYIIIYDHVEHLGDKEVSRGFDVGTVDGKTMKWGEDLLITMESPNKAKAISVFNKGVARTALLTKRQD